MWRFVILKFFRNDQLTTRKDDKTISFADILFTRMLFLMNGKQSCDIIHTTKAAKGGSTGTLGARFPVRKLCWVCFCKFSTAQHVYNLIVVYLKRLQYV